MSRHITSTLAVCAVSCALSIGLGIVPTYAADSAAQPKSASGNLGKAAVNVEVEEAEVVEAPVAAPKFVAKFDAPVRLKSGEADMGAFVKVGETDRKRHYPSPGFHDVNGDGHQDIVLGDLFGYVTVSLRNPSIDPGQPGAWGAEDTLKDVDGKDLKFHNW